MSKMTLYDIYYVYCYRDSPSGPWNVVLEVQQSLRCTMDFNIVNEFKMRYNSTKGLLYIGYYTSRRLIYVNTFGVSRGMN